MRLMFRATQAHVVDNDPVTGDCQFRLTPSSSPTVVNLLLRPSQVSASQVAVDDLRDDGGFSDLIPETSGPFEELGCLYIKEAEWQNLGLSVEPSVFREYELSAVYYTPDEPVNRDHAGHRYHGFHARIIEKSGPYAYCRIWPAEGSHSEPGNSVDAWVALHDAGDCDAAADLESGDWPAGWPARLKVSDGANAVGALYLNIDRIGPESGQIPTSVPKLPASLGRDSANSAGNSVIIDGVITRVIGDDKGVITLQEAPTRPSARPCELCKMLEPRRAKADKGDRYERDRGDKGGPFKAATQLVQTAIGHKRAMRRALEAPLNVSGTRASTELLDIQRIVMEGGRLALVEDAAGLLELLRRAVTCRPPRAGRVLDLIGHSVTSDRFLMLGSSIIDLSKSLSVLEATPTPVYAAFKAIGQEKLLQKLGIKIVRLIGCRTAESERGRNTIANLSNLLRVDVDAVCDLVSANEFGPEGYLGAVANLTEACPRTRWATATFTESFGGDTLSVNKPSKAPLAYVVTDGTNLFQLAEVRATLLEPDAGHLVRGLLARADAHVIVMDQSQDTRYRSFEVLFDHELVRVYPDLEGAGGGGVVYRVDPQRRQQLRDILDRHQPIVLHK